MVFRIYSPAFRPVRVNESTLTFEISPRDALTLLLLPVFAFLVYIGSIMNTAYGDNSLLLLTVFLVAALAFLVCLPGNIIPEKSYPFLIEAISFCLIFHVLWISPHLVGYNDVHLEYFLFQSVKNTGRWNTNFPINYNSALSITILPVIVQSLVNVDDTTLFKTMYPLALTFVPVVLFLAYRKLVDPKRAFLSAVFFIAYTSYFREVSLIGKEDIAQLIIASLILLTYGTSTIRRSREPITMMILGVGLVASHYSSANLYIGFVLLSLPLLVAFRKKSVISSTFATLFLLFALGYYVYASGGAVFTSTVQFVKGLYASFFSDFFQPAARGEVVLKFFGVGIRPALVNSINLIVQYSIQLLIVTGVVGLWKRRKSANGEFVSYASIGLVLVIAGVLLPYAASSINMSRIYQFTLIFLSPACVLGGESIFRTFSHVLFTLREHSWHVGLPNSNKSLTFTSCVIILFLLFNTGLINEISGAPPISFTLGMNRIRASNDPGLVTFLYNVYLPEQDHEGARWFSYYMWRDQSVCGDYVTRFDILLAYSGIPLEKGGAAVPLLYPWSVPRCTYVYLSYENLVKGIVTTYSTTYHISEFSNLEYRRDRIYSNGATVILSLECQSSVCWP